MASLWNSWSRLLASLGFSFALLGANARFVRGSSLELIVTESGGPPIPITDNGAFDTDPTIGSISVNTLLLNLTLVNYQFNTLGATSNSPGSAALGTLSQTGQVQLMPGGSGSIQVLASDVDYALPSGVSNVLLNSSSSTFTSAPAGDSQEFTSYFNPSNTLGATQQPSPTLDLVSTGGVTNSQGANTAPVPVTSAPPYGLSDTALITLTGGAPGANSEIQFAGTTAVTTAPVPVPAAVWGGLALLGVVGLGQVRRRRRRKIA